MIVLNTFKFILHVFTFFAQSLLVSPSSSI